jgi:transposase
MPPAEELYAENRSLKEENAELRAQIEWFKRKVFAGGQSEKLPPLPEPAQSRLALPGLTEKATTPHLQLVTYERRQPSGEKRPLPAETFAKLPVNETIIVEPDEVQAAPECFEKTGEERTF